MNSPLRLTDSARKKLSTCLSFVLLTCLFPSAAHTQDTGSAVERTQAALKVKSVCDKVGDGPKRCEGLARRVAEFASRPFETDFRPSREELVTALVALTNLGADTTINLANFLPLDSGISKVNTGSGRTLSLPAAALAVTDFMIERASAELAQATFNELVVWLQASRLGTLLPTTAAYFKDVNAIGYRSLMPALRAAAVEDVSQLPLNASALYETDELVVVATVYRALRRLDDGFAPVDVLAELRSATRVENSKLREALRMVGALAYEARAVIRTSSPGSRQDELVRFLQNTEEAPVLAAFLLADLNISGKHEVWFETHLGDLQDLAWSVRFLVSEQTSSSPMSPDKRISIIRRTANVLNTGMRLVDSTSAAPNRRAVELGLDLWEAVERREYSTIVVRTIGKLDSLSATERRVLTLASSVASAETDEQLQEALDAFVDPVGSFRARRTGGVFSVTLVGYLGGSLGRESLLETTGESATYAGAFAPLGIELSKATGSRFVSSMGLYLSLVDLGTLVSYRFSGDPATGSGAEKVETQPDINIDHIFSPAIHVVFGITPDHPFTVGFGYQRSPQLRTLTSGDRVNVERFSAFAAIDLSLLRF